MKKIIKLTESDLARIVRRVINEQMSYDDALVKAKEMINKGPKPTEPGSKYCFTKEFLAKDILQEGPHNIGMYKIKSGDSKSTIIQKTRTDQDLAAMNPRCKWGPNDIKANDVILYSKIPSN